MAVGPFDRNVSANNLSNKVLTNIFVATASPNTWNPTGGVNLTVTPPFLLALMTTAGTDTGNGTEATTSNSPGYHTLAAGGGSPATVAFTCSASVLTSSSAQSYTATGTWTSSIAGIEIWDSAATKLRYLQSGNSTFNAITGIASGDTVQFPAGSITYDGTGW